MRALENPSYDSWRLQSDPSYDLPLRICKCGAECDQDAYECADCEDKAWKELDAEELAFQEAVSREDERQAASQDHWDAEQERDLG